MRDCQFSTIHRHGSVGMARSIYLEEIRISLVCWISNRKWDDFSSHHLDAISERIRTDPTEAKAKDWMEYAESKQERWEARIAMLRNEVVRPNRQQVEFEDIPLKDSKGRVSSTGFHTNTLICKLMTAKRLLTSRSVSEALATKLMSIR